MRYGWPNMSGPCAGRQFSTIQTECRSEAAVDRFLLIAHSLRAKALIQVNRTSWQTATVCT